MPGPYGAKPIAAASGSGADRACVLSCPWPHIGRRTDDVHHLFSWLERRRPRRSCDRCKPAAAGDYSFAVALRL